MINFSSLYQELFNSGKIRYRSKILNIFFQNDTTICFNSKFILDNELYLTKFKISFETVIYNNKDKKQFDFLDDFNDYDVVLMSNLFSLHEKDQINEIIEILLSKKLNVYYMFLNEMICESFIISHHPFSYIRNLLYKVSNYNFGKNIHITDIYNIINDNHLRILDSSRMLSDNIIPTYPVEYFLIVSEKRYLY